METPPAWFPPLAPAFSGASHFVNYDFVTFSKVEFLITWISCLNLPQLVRCLVFLYAAAASIQLLIHSAPQRNAAASSIPPPPNRPPCSCADRGLGRRQEQPAVALHQERIQPGEQEHHRGGVCYTQHPGGRQDDKGPDLGHGGPRALQSHHVSVSLPVRRPSVRSKKQFHHFH